MKKLKTVVISAVVLLVVIVVLQNTEPVDTRVLFATLSMPRAVLLFVTFATGFVIGLLARDRVRPPGAEKKKP